MDLRTMAGESFRDEGAEELAGVGEGGDEQVVIRGNGGAVRYRPVEVIACPRCQSMNTKFCYYNNYSVTQRRHFCRNCQRYWTVGGTLRNVPVGGGSRKKTRTRARSDPSNIPTTYEDYSAAPQTSTPNTDHSLLNASTCMQQLSMLPPPSLAFPGGSFPTVTSHLPFLQSALDGLSGNLYPRKASPGLQEVPDIQSYYETQQIALPMSASPMLMNGLSTSFFSPQSFPNEPLVSAMSKAGLWSTGVQTTMAELPSSQFGGYGHRNLSQNVLVKNLKAAGVWESPVMHGRPVMDDRLVPHAAWDSNPSTTHNTPNLSPNGSSTGTDHHHLTFSHGGYYEDVSQPWVALHDTDVLNF